ncbi:MAG TPA: hypothetical protein VHZ54_10205, partial [Solirubrobacterales bacterium]|nr:hypothetical protein [Solirubrobacterales bacterium]
MKEKDLGLKFWAAVAVSAIGMGVAIAFVAGFFLGHYTGHSHTTTVVSAQTSGGETSTEETTTTEEETTEAAEGEAWTLPNGDVQNTRNVASGITAENVAELAP